MLAKDGAQKQLKIVADARAKHTTEKLANTVADAQTGSVGTVAGSQVSSVGVPAAPDDLVGSPPQSATGANHDGNDDAMSGRDSRRRRKRPSSDDIDRRERAAGAAERRRKIERRRGIGEDRAAMLERDSQASNPSRV